MKYLLDSNTVIYYFNGDIKVQSFLEEHKEQSSISIIIYYEILNYNFSLEEEKIVKKFLETFKIINLSKNIIYQALENRKDKKIKMADNFIVATAQIFELLLVTRNVKDFMHFPFMHLILLIVSIKI